MGGGNAQKSATARARKEKNAKGVAKSSLKDTNRASIVCKICTQTFACTTNKIGLTEHYDGKHNKKGVTFE
eukprot:Awhi_evm1s6876